MTCIYKWKYLNCNSKWIYENAWNSLKNQGNMSIFMEWKWDEKWLIFMIENSLKMDDEKSFINMIGFWKWLMKISENGKPIINTSEIIFWIMIWKIMISMRIKMYEREKSNFDTTWQGRVWAHNCAGASYRALSWRIYP